MSYAAPPPYACPALPTGWEARQSPDGRIYYVDHNTCTTHWTPPPAPSSPPAYAMSHQPQTYHPPPQPQTYHPPQSQTYQPTPQPQMGQSQTPPRKAQSQPPARQAQYPSPPGPAVGKEKYMCCSCKKWRKHDAQGNCYKCGHTPCEKRTGIMYGRLQCGLWSKDKKYRKSVQQQNALGAFAVLGGLV